MSSSYDLKLSARPHAALTPVLAANLLLLALVLAENFFGLVDTSAFNIAGVVNIDLVWQGSLLILSICLYAKSLRCEEGRASAFEGFLLLLLVFLCIFASIRCQELTGQPFVRGLLPQRGFIVACLSAMLLRRPFKAGLIDGRRLIDGIIVLGAIASCLYLLQVVLGSSVTLIHAGAGERYGGLRLYVKSALSDAAGILSFWLLLRSGRGRYMAPVLLTLGVILLVSKGRLELITYLAVLAFLLISERGSLNIKALVVCFGFLALMFFATSNFADQVVQSFVNGQIGGSEDNSTIRKAGREWYDLMLLSHENGILLGCGYPSVLYEPATIMAGYNQGYYLIDNGISAFRYVHGGLGMTVVIVFLLQFLWRVLKRGDSGLRTPIVAFALFLVIPLQNFAWWWGVSDWQALTALFIGLAWISPAQAMRIVACDEKS